MDYKKLIPDFKSVSKTDWAKPHIDTKDKNWLILAGCALLMVIFVFIPWFTASEGLLEVNVLGITWMLGIFGLIFALVAVYGVLYNSLQFVFCGAVLAAIMGLIAWMVIPDVELEIAGKTVTVTSEQIKEGVKHGITKVSHLGSILFFLVSLALAAVSFLQIKKANE